MSALTKQDAHPEALLTALRPGLTPRHLVQLYPRLVGSKAELLGNHSGLSEAVARHLAGKPEVVASAVRALGRLGEGARYADHVAAVLRWPSLEVRLAAVEVGGSGVVGG